MWAKFSVEWQRVLDLPPRLAYFKRSEAESRTPTKEFKGWKRTDIDARVAALVDVIHRHVAARVHCAITRNEYEAIKKLFAKGLLKFDDPYVACFFGLLQTVAFHNKKRNIQTPVDFIFDEEGVLGRHAAQFYDVFN
jgi:hypothetical protein